MPKFVKIQKPQEAVQWFKSGDHPAVVRQCVEGTGCETVSLEWGIETKEGFMLVRPGNWVMTGPRGEHWSIDQEIFAETYREVTSKELDLLTEIEKYRDEPGVLGSFYRLMARLNVHQVLKWCEGEKVRGVPPETLFDALGEFIGTAATYGAGMVSRSKMHKAAGAIYEFAHAKTNGELRALDEAKRSRDTIKNPLKLVKG